jgi:hypothetical protein
MKRIIYTVFTTAYLVLSAAPHSAELSAPTPLGATVGVAQVQGGPVASLSEPPHFPPRGAPFIFPGEVAIRTHSGNFLTAVGGGGQTTDTFHTDLKDATKIGSWEKFKLWSIPGAPGRKIYAIQTKKGYYVTATGGGSQVTEPALQVSRLDLLLHRGVEWTLPQTRSQSTHLDDRWKDHRRAGKFFQHCRVSILSVWRPGTEFYVHDILGLNR